MAVSVICPKSDEPQVFKDEALQWLFEKCQIAYQNILEEGLVTVDLGGRGYCKSFVSIVGVSNLRHVAFCYCMNQNWKHGLFQSF